MNPRVAAIEGSLIRALHAKKKPDSIDLGLGEPSLLPTMSYFEAATAYVAEHGCRYTTNAGDHELRELIAKHYAYPGMDEASNVCITIGSQEAVYVTMTALLDPAKDEVLLIEPAFAAYGKVARLLGVATRTVAMSEDDDFALDPERILAGITPATRMIVLTSPCNPTGRVMSASEMQRLADGLLARSGPPIAVLHDEIYRELTFTPDAGSFADLYPHTIAINSLSKSNALTGMRTGWTIAPSALAPAIVKTHGWVASTANTYAQRIGVEIFRTPGALQEHYRWYSEHRIAVLEALVESGLRFIEPDGSFYACVQIGEGVDSLAFAETLIAEDNVVAIPGRAFGACFEGWLRLSWVGSINAVREGLTRIAARAATFANG